MNNITMFAVGLALLVPSFVGAEMISERTGGPVAIGKEKWENLAEAKGVKTARFWSVTEPVTNATLSLFGSNDGKKWTLVDEEAYQIGWKTDETRYWKTAKPGTYSHYKVTSTDFSGKSKIALKSWGVYDPSAAKGATFYVDAVQGDDARSVAEAQSEAKPWKTISRAVEAAKGGDTILIADGIYRESVTITAKKGGTASAPLVIRGRDPKRRPVIDGAVMLDPSGWRKTTLTNFRGKTVAALVREMDFVPNGLFAGERRLVVAHEPAQQDGDSPYETKYMMTVDGAANASGSKNRLTDEKFLTQREKDYWKGATLKLFDGFGNAFGENEIVSYDPSAHAIETKSLPVTIGSDHGRPDKWCLCNHLGVLDEPGEYYVEASASSVKLYLVPGEIDLKTLSAGKFECGIFLPQVGGITIANIDFRNQSKFCINSKNGSHFKPSNIRIEDCRITHAGASGLALRHHEAVVVSRCEFSYNGDNGISFANMYNSAVYDCQIVRNGNNGFWAGCGTKYWFSDDGITFRGCEIRDQEGLRQHPDNYQMHQCDNVVITDCTMVQKGHQNGWCQYTGHLVFRNNYLENGPFGFGAVQYAEIAHNVFSNACLRFDAHNDDHPTHKNGYCPKDVRIFGNIVIKSPITWPKDPSVDKFKAFTIAGNLHDAASVGSWDYQGEAVSLYPGTMLVRTLPSLAEGKAVAYGLEVAAVWSDPGRVVPLWKDAENYYWFSVGSKGKQGLFRHSGGIDTQIGAAKELIMAHAGKGPAAKYAVTVASGKDGLVFTIAKDGGKMLKFVDSDPAAKAKFVGDLAFGVSSPENAHPNAWYSLRSAEIAGKKLTIDRALSGWKTVSGKTAISNLGGCFGIGIGPGAYIGTPADAAKVQSPDGLPVGLRAIVRRP